MESICPSLTNVTPASFNALRNARAVLASCSSRPACPKPRSREPNPWRTAMERISVYRRERCRRALPPVKNEENVGNEPVGKAASMNTRAATPKAKIQPIARMRNKTATEGATFRPLVFWSVPARKRYCTVNPMATLITETHNDGARPANGHAHHTANHGGGQPRLKHQEKQSRRWPAEPPIAHPKWPSGRGPW
ncbi:hypothetical protein B857_03906 [Solibacillus isronensis B3W22]|uniref:Uncharacterized protein n=1 Tax=Solibacillus isronensis B3W22 TaxID=1224748 RepID=K1KGT8_9BACL|nr:hypothetical protein B857_03906 [Solibacillus isronensis B3W22]